MEVELFSIGKIQYSMSPTFSDHCGFLYNSCQCVLEARDLREGLLFMSYSGI